MFTWVTLSTYHLGCERDLISHRESSDIRPNLGYNPGDLVALDNRIASIRMHPVEDMDI
jgi:hypothetical protein